MRTFNIFIALLILVLPLYPQTNVDKLVRTLDSLSTSNYNDWKVSPDLKGFRRGLEPAQPGFDDSKWDNLKLRVSIHPDSCWLRKEIILPEQVLGQPVKGAVKFMVSVDDAGYLWVNGQYKGYFPWDGEFELTKDAKPGQKFLLAVKAINTGGPLRLLRAEVQLETTKPINQMIQDFAMSMRVGQKLLSFDTYQTSSNHKVDPGTDKSRMDKAEKTRLSALLQDLAARVDPTPLAIGDLNKFRTSLDNVRTQLKPIGMYAKKFTLYFDANAHIDAAWLWREKETVELTKNTFASVINMMNIRPDFTYTQSSAAYYDWMERLYPDLFKKIQERVKQGRWEIIGGMWIEPDCNLIGGESWNRQILYAKKYFLKKFGVNVVIGWNPDSFGYNWNMPQFYTDAGINAFITQKIGWNETNVFPYRVFWWEGPDGSKILTYFPFDYVSTVDNPYRLVDWLRQFEANTGFTKMMILFGVGDHGGGPSLEMIDRIEHLREIDIFPAIEYGTSIKYLDWIRSQDLTTIPTWNDELYLEYHQGTYTTQANGKASNRKSEMLLTNVEKFSSIASLYGRKYNSADIQEAWTTVMFNQFHDILPGSSIHEVYVDTKEKYNESFAIGSYELKSSLGQIARQVNTADVKKGTPLLVFNGLSWDRTDAVTVRLPEADEAIYAVFDDKNTEVPSQVVRKDKYHREILFIAENIPAMGYRSYELRKQRSIGSSTALSVSPTVLENQYFRVAVDEDAGWVKSIFDKKNSREVLKGYGNRLQLLEDLPAQYDAWNIGLTGREFPSTFRNIEIVEKGPVRVVLRATRDYLKPGTVKDYPTEDFPSTFFTQDIILYSRLDRIDFRTDVDWWEDKTMLKVAFPVSVTDTVASYEIPYGSITRSNQWRNSWDSAKVEVPAVRWADLSQNDFGVSLLNNSKYGYDVKGNVLRLSLLRSPKSPDPLADRGKHSIEYSLYPHAGRWRQAKTVERGYEINNPLIAVMTEPHKGTLPSSQSFVRLSPANLVLTTVKKAEESDAWIIQWYDAKGENSEATLTLPKQPSKVVRSNSMEDDGAPVAFEKNTIKVQTKKNSMVTVKVYY